MRGSLAIVNLTRKYYPFSNILFGLGIYLVGLMISFYYGASYFFLQVPYFSLGCFGIIWVSSMWTWAFNSLREIMNELKESFEIPESKFDNEARHFVELISSDKKAFFCSIPGYFFVAYHMWLMYSGKILLPFEIPKAVQNITFGIYVSIFFSTCIYFVFASAYILINALIFLKKLTKFPIRINILQVKKKIRLRRTIKAILIATIGWFVGASLVMTLLFVYANVVIIGFMIFIIAVGLMFFFIPQILIHNSICKSKEALLQKIESEFSSKVKLPLSPQCDVVQALLLCALFDQVERISEWPVEINTLLQLFGSTIIPIGTALVNFLL